MTASRNLAIRRRRIHALGDRATRSESVHGPTAHEPSAALLSTRASNGSIGSPRLRPSMSIVTWPALTRPQQRARRNHASVVQDEPAAAK